MWCVYVMYMCVCVYIYIKTYICYNVIIYMLERERWRKTGGEREGDKEQMAKQIGWSVKTGKAG